MPKYSIIVPVYNAEQYLAKSLESALTQSFDDIEIICVNDGSTDSSREIITDLAILDERIRLIDKPNGGPSSARNVGIDAATGDYICFLDADDLLETRACERLNRELAGYDVDAVVFGWSYFPENQADRFVREHADVRYAYYERFEHKLLFSEMSNPYLRLAIKRSALLNSGVRFDENLYVGEDCQFLFALYPRIGSVRLIADKLYRYRLPRPGSVMADFKSDVESLCMSDFDMTVSIFKNWNADGLREECGQVTMALENRLGVFVACFGEGHIAVVRLRGKLLLFQQSNGFVNGCFRDAHMVCDVNRANGLFGCTAKHDDCLKVVLVRHGDFYHYDLFPTGSLHNTIPQWFSWSDGAISRLTAPQWCIVTIYWCALEFSGKEACYD